MFSMQVGREFAGRLQADFVEHAPEIHDSADFLMGTAGIFHQGKDGSTLLRFPSRNDAMTNKPAAIQMHESATLNAGQRP